MDKMCYKKRREHRLSGHKNCRIGIPQEYVRNWIKRNLQNVAEIDDDWCE